MPLSLPHHVPTNTSVFYGTHLRVDDAGGINRRFVLAADYLPRSGKKRKTIKSNYRAYGKSWASREEITDSDREEFVTWINTKLASGGGSRLRPPKSPQVASRSSLRLDKQMTLVCTPATDLVVERAVVQCLKFLVDNVIHVIHGDRLNKALWGGHLQQGSSISLSQGRSERLRMM